MKILFTKTLDKKWVTDSLGSGFSVYFVDTVKNQHIKTSPFVLRNYSLIFTNPDSVVAFFKNGFKPNENFSTVNYNKIYAIGIDTKKELRKHHFGTYKLFKTIDDFCDFTYHNTTVEKFIYFSGNNDCKTIVEKLKNQNINFRKVTVYNTELLYPKVKDKYQSLVFFCPHDVQSFAKHNKWQDFKLFSANPETTSELKKFVNKQIFTSTKSTLDDVIKLIRKEENNPDLTLMS